MIAITPFTKLPPKHYNSAVKAQRRTSSRRRTANTASSTATRRTGDYQTLNSFALDNTWPFYQEELEELWQGQDCEDDSGVIDVNSDEFELSNNAEEQELPTHEDGSLKANHV